MKNILYSKDIYDYFKENNYHIMNLFHIVNNKDTVLYSAGIKPLLSEFINGRLEENENIFIAQPVIRTQYVDLLSEGAIIFGKDIDTCQIMDEKIEMDTSGLYFLHDISLLCHFNKKIKKKIMNT